MQVVMAEHKFQVALGRDKFICLGDGGPGRVGPSLPRRDSRPACASLDQPPLGPAPEESPADRRTWRPRTGNLMESRALELEVPQPQRSFSYSRVWGASRQGAHVFRRWLVGDQGSPVERWALRRSVSRSESLYSLTNYPKGGLTEGPSPSL